MGGDRFRRAIDMNVNGTTHTIEVESNWTLLKVLRDALNLTGAKCGCDEGHCGACTVLIDGKAVLSCLTLVVRCHQRKITTIEGLATGENLHPLQESFIQRHAMQCGFCTPGMIMSAKALLDENPDPSEEEMKRYLCGNICRCGTYPKITQSIRDAAGKLKEVGQ